MNMFLAALLHDDMEKEIYKEQQEGFIIKGKYGYISKLKKSLYGLNQARHGKKCFESIMVEQN